MRERCIIFIMKKTGKAHSTITFQDKHLGNLPEKHQMLSVVCNVHLAACPCDCLQTFE